MVTWAGYSRRTGVVAQRRSKRKIHEGQQDQEQHASMPANSISPARDHARDKSQISEDLPTKSTRLHNIETTSPRTTPPSRNNGSAVAKADEAPEQPGDARAGPGRERNTTALDVPLAPVSGSSDLDWIVDAAEAPDAARTKIKKGLE